MINICSRFATFLDLFLDICSVQFSHSVTSDSLRPRGHLLLVCILNDILTLLWIFIGRTDAKAEAPILWPLDSKIWLTGKDPDAGQKDWEQEKKGKTEDEMIGWHHWLNGHEFEQTQGDSDPQTVHGVTKSQSRLSDWTTTFHDEKDG